MKQRCAQYIWNPLVWKLWEDSLGNVRGGVLFKKRDKSKDYK